MYIYLCFGRIRIACLSPFSRRLVSVVSKDGYLTGIISCCPKHWHRYLSHGYYTANATMLKGPAPMAQWLCHRLIDTGFASRYRLKPLTGFLKAEWVGVKPLTSNRVTTTGVTKAVVCFILSVGWCI